MAQQDPGIFTGGQMTDLPLFTPNSFDGTELFEIVAPGSAALGINYRITSAKLGGLLGSITANPGGSSGQIQWNNSEAFGGIAGWTTDGANALIGGVSSTIAMGGATIGSNSIAITGNIAANSSSQSLQVNLTSTLTGGNTGFIATGDSGTYQFTVRGSTSGNTGPFNVPVSGQIIATGGLTNGMWIQAAANAPIVFVTGSDTNFANERMRILGSAATTLWGGPDAASPATVTFSMQNVLAGTSNATGADTIINLSQGTGTGSGGGLHVKFAAPGSTGSTKNALADGFVLTGAGSFVIGNAAVATTATDGFLYIPTCSGTPTGTPTTQTGRVALVYDTSAHQFWIYDGGWKQPKTPGAAAIVTWQ